MKTKRKPNEGRNPVAQHMDSVNKPKTFTCRKRNLKKGYVKHKLSAFIKIIKIFQ